MATGPPSIWRRFPPQAPHPDQTLRQAATEPRGEGQTDQRQTRPKTATDPVLDLKIRCTKKLQALGLGRWWELGAEGTESWAAIKTPILGNSQAGLHRAVSMAREVGPEKIGSRQGCTPSSAPAHRSLSPWVRQFRPGCMGQLRAGKGQVGAQALWDRCPSWQQ